MNELSIPLNEKSGEHLYLQIYNYMKKEIQRGSLAKGQRLPSTRALAQHLQVSRSTVDFAYGQLLSEGYIESIPYKGYFVCEMNQLYKQLPTKQYQRETRTKKQAAFDFSPNKIDISFFPFPTWKKISKSVFLDEEREVFELGESKGDFRLREAICSYIHSSRGVSASPNQIIVGAGNEYLLLLLQKILGEKRRTAVENPTYKRAAQIFTSGGYSVIPVAMDEMGMQVEALNESAADIAYITPSHQFPTGIVMPIGRRMDLLSWAGAREDRFLIEDDYDSEFRYRGKPIPSLQSSDSNGKVIYLGTFSKSIAPAIRISYMVLPEKLMEIYERKLGFMSSTVSRIDQAILYHFIADGHFERYLNKMRKIYKDKHDLLLEQIKDFRTQFKISGEYAGLHILLEDQMGRSEQELMAAAGEQECNIYGMSAYYLEKKPEKATILLGFAAMNETQIIEGVQRLRAAWNIKKSPLPG